MVGYYKWFVKNTVTYAKLLTTLMTNDAPLKWSNSYKESFQELKRSLTSTSFLILSTKGKDYDILIYPSHQG